MPSSAPSISTNVANCETEPGKGNTTGSPASTCWINLTGEYRWPRVGSTGDAKRLGRNRYKVAKCIQAEPVFCGFGRSAHSKVISVTRVLDQRS